MFSKTFSASLALTALALTGALQAAVAQAQTATPRVDAREARQQARIQQGVASGQLNARETTRLQHGQAHVETMETKAKADGVVTAQERARLEHAQDVQSRRIYRQKHDGQRAGS